MLFSIVAAPTHIPTAVWEGPLLHILASMCCLWTFVPSSLFPLSLCFFPFLSRFFLLFSSFGSNILPYFLYFNLLSLTPF